MVYVFKYTDSGWIRFGDNIIGKSEMSNSGVASGYRFGHNVSLSSDGKKLLVSAPSAFKSHSDGTTFALGSGAAYIYNYSETEDEWK